METARLSQARTANASRSAGPPAWLAPALAVLALYFGGASGMWSNPPRFYPTWTATFFAVMATCGAALWCSARRRGLAARLAQAASILMSLLVWTIPLNSCLRAFHDFPWFQITAMGVFLAVVAILCRQWWALACLVVGVGCWTWATSRPASLTLPASVRDGGVTLTLQSVDSGRLVNFRLDPKADLQRINLEDVRLRAFVPPGLEVTAWPPHGKEPMDAPGRFSCWTFTPRWSRSMDLEVIVPEWPKAAAAQVVIPVPPEGGTSAGGTAQGEGMSLVVGQTRWSRTTSQDPAERCVAAEIKYSGNSYSASMGGELRAVDENGREISISWSSMTGSEDGATIAAELQPIPKGCRRITISLFSEAQRKSGEHRFRFRGVPNRTVNLGPDDSFIPK